MNNIIFFVPARQGSKGLIGKNFRLMDGKPLLMYTLELIRSLNLENSSVIISTDNLEFHEKVLEYGFLLDKRSEELAGDDVLINDVILNAVGNSINVLKNEATNWIVLLEPTTPLRTLESICSLVKLISENSYTSIVSVVEDSSVMWYPTGASLSRVSISSSNRQMRSKAFREVGVFYASTWEHFLSSGFFSESTVPVVVGKEESLDINDIYEWTIVECLMKRKNELF